MRASVEIIGAVTEPLVLIITLVLQLIQKEIFLLVNKLVIESARLHQLA